MKIRSENFTLFQNKNRRWIFGLMILLYRISFEFCFVHSMYSVRFFFCRVLLITDKESLPTVTVIQTKFRSISKKLQKD